jgi:predicted RNase H-like HicB family nuclease
LKQTFIAGVWREGDWVVAQCREVDIDSQGQTEDEALANLKEVLELHFEPPVATVYPVHTLQTPQGNKVTARYRP